jgi:sugar phosphate isomerase/epimerase
LIPIIKTHKNWLCSGFPELMIEDCLVNLQTTVKAMDAGAPLAKMGIAATSFGGAIYGARSATGQSSSAAASPQVTASQSQALATVPQVPGAPGSRHADTLEFLERCHALGASGIQTHINGDLRKLRARAEELGMWMEGMVSACSSTPEQFEKAISDAKAAGCTVARDAMLSGRRYETFNSLADWNAWLKQSFKVIERVVPVLEKHKFTLALENHKDWTIDEYVKLFKTYSSEYLGACLDFGNNVSLLDDPMVVIEAAAPYTKATHIKDLAVMPHQDGLLMSEVPLGTGLLDLPRIISLLQKANPNIRFALEMITRDPLKVPCLTDHYWVTFPDRSGIYLARTLRYVNGHKSAKPLPTFDHLSPAERSRVEEENIRACFQYARGAA